MTLVQLEYIVAVDTYRHFARAAKQCFVTQPTLSMQIHKLEKELGTKIFDRNKQPVLPTQAGADIISQARVILAQRDTMEDMIQTKKGIISGELKIGIIPTLAPYLLPLFVQSFIKKYPLVKMIVNELTTEYILMRLREGRIDAGILVTPLRINGITEDILFYEELVAYVSKTNAAYKRIMYWQRISTLLNFGCWRKVIASVRRSLICASCRKVVRKVLILSMRLAV